MKCKTFSEDIYKVFLSIYLKSISYYASFFSVANTDTPLKMPILPIPIVLLQLVEIDEIFVIIYYYL